MILRPAHSCVIMAAAITGRDSTARYSAMRGPKAASWRKADLIRPLNRKRYVSISFMKMNRNSMRYFAFIAR